MNWQTNLWRRGRCCAGAKILEKPRVYREQAGGQIRGWGKCSASITFPMGRRTGGHKGDHGGAHVSKRPTV